MGSSILADHDTRAIGREVTGCLLHKTTLSTSLILFLIFQIKNAHFECTKDHFSEPQISDLIVKFLNPETEKYKNVHTGRKSLYTKQKELGTTDLNRNYKK